MAQYIALLRGINVGGRNLIRMTDLKACFEEHGLQNVRTYIQSGNVLFETSERSSKRLTEQIERLLDETFNYEGSVVLRSLKQLRDTVERAPRGFGSKPDRYRYDVLFLKSPLTGPTALKGLPLKEGVDEVAAGPGALYFARLISKITQSRLSRIASMPIYQSITIRNWNTTTKLLKLMA
jgi:uncharacterized protein (DUF1697 family)